MKKFLKELKFNKDIFTIQDNYQGVLYSKNLRNEGSIKIYFQLQQGYLFDKDSFIFILSDLFGEKKVALLEVVN